MLVQFAKKNLSQNLFCTDIARHTLKNNLAVRNVKDLFRQIINLKIIWQDTKEKKALNVPTVKRHITTVQT